jgi:hypothetical protein
MSGRRSVPCVPDVARLRIVGSSALAVTLALLGCAGPAQTPVPTPTATPLATLAPAHSIVPTQTTVPTPNVIPTQAPWPTTATGDLVFPTISAVPLIPGRYLSAPPFDIPFTFEIPDPGWESAHLLGEFFDVMRFDDQSVGTGQPTRWVAFAHPTHIQGAQQTPVEGLSATEAAQLLADRPDLTAGPTTPFELDGLEGVRLDLHASSPRTAVFGGAGGDFGFGPENDLRLAVVPQGDALLLVLVLAAPVELEAAWLDAQPILDSVDLRAVPVGS